MTAIKHSMNTTSERIVVPIVLYILLLAFGISQDVRGLQGYYYFPVAVAIFWWLAKRGEEPGLWTLVLVWVAALIDTAGNIYSWYGTLGWFDDFAHGYGIGAITLFAAPVIQSVYPRLSYIHTAWIAFLVASFIGVLYEIGELWTQELTGVRILWGEKDAPEDLQWNTVGATIAFIILIYITKRAQKTPQRKFLWDKNKEQ
jgi:hypothetical protein